ncbi:hypothetical protein SNEBB_005668 [Seison nebaliae]|nr:hypothetical protein SNEBB_005668 [Seison nebaliae]
MFKLTEIGWKDAKQYTNIRVNDIYDLNFTFTFQAHGIPIANRILMDQYIDIEQQLDDILKKYEDKQPTPSAIVMNYDHHIASFAYSFYKIRLISITAKIVEVLRKIPDIKIMLKGAGKQEKNGVSAPYTQSYNPFIRQTLRLSTEIIQFMNSRFLHYIWKSIRNEENTVRKRLIFLNFYPLSEMLCNPKLHLCEEIVIQEFFIITRYL